MGLPVGARHSRPRSRRPRRYRGDLARKWAQQLSAPQSSGLLIARAAAVLAQSSDDHPGMLTALEPSAGAPRVGLMADGGAPWWPLYIEALIGTGTCTTPRS